MINIKDLKVGDVLINNTDNSIHLVCRGVDRDKNNCIVYTDKSSINFDTMCDYDLVGIEKLLDDKIKKHGDFARVGNSFAKISNVVSFHVSVGVRYINSNNTYITISADIKFADGFQNVSTKNYTKTITAYIHPNEVDNRQLSTSLEVSVIAYILDLLNIDSDEKQNSGHNNI